MAENKPEEAIEVEVKLKGVAKIKKDLKDIKNDLADATDPADIERLSIAAGALGDKLTDINEKIAIFAAGSDFEKINNGLGLVSSQLSNMDFEGASESAKLLNTTIKNMDPKEIANGFKAFIGTIGQLTKSFVQMGVKLLLNPLFFLVAVIGGIIVAFIALKDKIKILQVAFDTMMTPINLIIQGLKNLADWMGITAFAAEESADRQVAANKRVAESSKEVTDSKVAQLDREIKLSKAAGKDVTELELKKQDVLKKGSEDLLKLARSTYAELDAIRKNGKSKLTEDQQKEFEAAAKTIKTEKENIKNFETEKNVIILTKNKEAQDNADKATKEASDKRKAANDKERQEVQKHKDDLINLNKKYYTDIADLNAKTEEEKFALQKKRDLEEINNLKAVNKEQENIKKELLENFNKKYALLEAKIEQDKVDKLKEITETYNKEVRDLKLKTEQEKLKQQELDALAEIDKITQDETKKEEAKKAVREKYALLKRDADATDFTKEQTETLSKLENEKLTFEERFKIIDEQQKLLNANTLLNDSERDAAQLELDRNKKEQEIAFETAKNEAIASSKENLNNIISGIEATGLAKTKAGQAVAKALALTQIGIDSAVALSKASTLANAEGAAAQLAFPMVPGAGTIARVISYTSTALSVATNIVKAKKLLSGGGNATPSGSVGGGGATSQPAQPSFQLFGGKNQGNEATSSQTVESRQQNQTITVNAIVSETEMTNTQNRVRTIQQNAEL